MTTLIYGWHFSTGCLGYGDGREIKTGVTHTVDVVPKCCERGLHASRRAIDALQYAPPDAIVARVRLDGRMHEQADKIAATSRTYLWVADASAVLHEFACNVAEAALLLAEVDDKRCWQAIEAKHAWLRGEIDDVQLDATSAAVSAVVWAASNASVLAAFSAARAASSAAMAAANAARAASSAAMAAANAARAASSAAMAAPSVARAASSASVLAAWDVWAAPKNEQNIFLTDCLMDLAPAGFIDPEHQS